MFGQFQTPINYKKLIEIQSQQESYRLTKRDVTKQSKKQNTPKVKKISIGRKTIHK